MVVLSLDTTLGSKVSTPIGSGSRAALALRRAERYPIRQPDPVCRRSASSPCLAEKVATSLLWTDFVDGLNRRLLADHDGLRCSELAKGADPLTRDSEGNVPLHLARTVEHVRTLLQAAPAAAWRRNRHGETPLEVIIRELRFAGQQRKRVLQSFRDILGPAPFFSATATSTYSIVPRTCCGLLSSEEREGFELCGDWETVVGNAFQGDVKCMIKSIYNLKQHSLPQPEDVADGAFRFLLFECADISELQRRLSETRAAAQKLLEAGCGRGPADITLVEEATCISLARWLLTVSVGFLPVPKAAVTPAGIGAPPVGSIAPTAVDSVIFVADMFCIISDELSGLYSDLLADCRLQQEEKRERPGIIEFSPGQEPQMPPPCETPSTKAFTAGLGKSRDDHGKSCFNDVNIKFPELPKSSSPNSDLEHEDAHWLCTMPPAGSLVNVAPDSIDDLLNIASTKQKEDAIQVARERSERFLRHLTKDLAHRMQLQLKFAISRIGLRRFKQRCDRNKDGTLDAEELLRLLRKDLRITPESLPDSGVSALIAALDDDDSGSLSLEEFLDFVERGPETFFRDVDNRPAASAINCIWCARSPEGVCEGCRQRLAPVTHKLASRTRLRHDLPLNEEPTYRLTQNPAWVITKDLPSALVELKRLGVNLGEFRPTPIFQDVDVSEEDVFAWLHAIRHQRVSETAQSEIAKILGAIIQGPGVLSVTFQERARDLPGVWQDAREAWAEVGKDNELTPANFVCDMNGASAVFSSASALQACFERCRGLTLQRDRALLVRVDNDFHITATAPRCNYRHLKLWLAVKTPTGVFLAKASLHLKHFHSRWQASSLLADCADGLFEPDHERQWWRTMFSAWSDLAKAEKSESNETNLESAIEKAMQCLTTFGPKLGAGGAAAVSAVARARLKAAETRLRELRADNRRLRDAQDMHAIRQHLETCCFAACRHAPTAGPMVMGVPVMHLAEKALEKHRREHIQMDQPRAHIETTGISPHAPLSCKSRPQDDQHQICDGLPQLLFRKEVGAPSNQTTGSSSRDDRDEIHSSHLKLLFQEESDGPRKPEAAESDSGIRGQVRHGLVQSLLSGKGSEPWKLVPTEDDQEYTRDHTREGLARSPSRKGSHVPSGETGSGEQREIRQGLLRSLTSENIGGPWEPQAAESGPEIREQVRHGLMQSLFSGKGACPWKLPTAEDDHEYKQDQDREGLAMSPSGHGAHVPPGETGSEEQRQIRQGLLRSLSSDTIGGLWKPQATECDPEVRDQIRGGLIQSLFGRKQCGPWKLPTAEDDHEYNQDEDPKGLARSPSREEAHAPSGETESAEQRQIRQGLLRSLSSEETRGPRKPIAAESGSEIRDQVRHGLMRSLLSGKMGGPWSQAVENGPQNHPKQVRTSLLVPLSSEEIKSPGKQLPPPESACEDDSHQIRDGLSRKPVAAKSGAEDDNVNIREETSSEGIGGPCKPSSMKNSRRGNALISALEYSSHLLAPAVC